MAITQSDLPELVRLLQQHPEWREALRLILLGEELINLPQLVRQIVETQHQIVNILQEIVQVQRRHEQQIAQLIEGQRRHEEWLQRLSEGQQRHEEWLQRLSEGQQRHEEILRQHTEWLQRLTETQERLIEEQQRNSQRLAHVETVQDRLIREFEELRSEFQALRQELRQEVKELRSEVGRMMQALGLTVEEHAEDILITVMERKGWKLVRGPNSLALNGELDLIAVFEDTDGQQRTVLMEVKLRLSRREVEAWAHRGRSEGFIRKLQEQGFRAPYHPYLFGFRIDVAADDAARHARMGLITSRGELLEPEVIEQV